MPHASFNGPTLSAAHRPVIRTSRLLLRPFQASDLPQYATANADPEVMRFLGGTIDRAASDSQALGANRSIQLKRYGKIAIERISDGAFVGMCGLSCEHWYPNDLELGWRLLPCHTGNGYATEAARAWLDYAFEVLDTPRILSIADVPNLKSIAVMQRLGMTLDHTADLEASGEKFVAVVYSISRHRSRWHRTRRSQPQAAAD